MSHSAERRGSSSWTRSANSVNSLRACRKTYEQEGKGDRAIIYLHYFIGNCNWYITEKDSAENQLQAFGLADLGYGPEYGYISIKELLENGAELDLYYKPRTVAEQMDEVRQQRS